MSRLLALAKTYVRLGPASIGRVAAYRLGLRSGLHPVQRLSARLAKPPFFRAVEVTNQLARPNRAWDERLWWFGWHHEAVPDNPPDWFANPFSSTVQPNASSDWWRIADFGAGDIKGLWELSRMDWVVAWATTAACGDATVIERLNEWLADWAKQNSPYMGPNWKCGQEASIRVMHLVLASWVLGQDRQPTVGLVDLVRTHLQRIAPTISYAIGQQNNHGTSEAAALFIGGSFLEGRDPRAEKWETLGRKWLEERATALIEPDGSFSQYSVNYHRVMLDTYSFAEAWCRHRDLPRFSAQLQDRLASATDWLWTMTNAESGDAPNIGANDGARLLQLCGTDYRDFRPSVQLAASLFIGADAFGRGPWDAPLHWLQVPIGEPWALPRGRAFNDGGFIVLRMNTSMAVLRYPRFRFRPSQADLLHLDFWLGSVNLLRDAGTYSYNDKITEWFSGTSAHNTIEFDGRDQMPRFGRFLFGRWLRADLSHCEETGSNEATSGAGYTLESGASHHRVVALRPHSLVCEDAIGGEFHTATLRWRLAPADWRVRGGVVESHLCSIAIEVDGVRKAPVFGHTLESRYYQQQTEIPEISLTVDGPSKLTTRISF